MYEFCFCFHKVQYRPQWKTRLRGCFGEAGNFPRFSKKLHEFFGPNFGLRNQKKILKHEQAAL